MRRLVSLPGSPASPFLFIPPKYTTPLSVAMREKVPALSHVQCSTLAPLLGSSTSFHSPLGTSFPVMPNTAPLPV